MTALTSLLRSLHAKRDLAITLAALALLLCWEASGWDLAVAGWYGNTGGFALRDNWFTRALLHDGGRALAGAALLAAVPLAWRGAGSRAPRWRRLAWLGLVLACLLLVPSLKRLSSTSCPWDLAAFGGTLPYVTCPPWGGPDQG